MWWGNGLLGVPCFFGTILLHSFCSSCTALAVPGIIAPSGIGREARLGMGALVYHFHPHLPSFALALDEALKKLRKIFFHSMFLGTDFNHLFLMLSERILSKQSCRIALLPQPVLLNYLVRVVLVADGV